MAAPVILISATPRRASDGAAQTVLLAGGGALYPYRYGGGDYRAGIVELPDFVTSLPFDGGDFGAGGVPQAAEVQWSPASNDDLAAMAALFWLDAPVAVRIGPENATRTLPPVVLRGKVLSATTEGGVLKLTLCDPAGDLKMPLLTQRYGGTGALDGPAEWEGKIKRRVWGRVWNMAGELIDKAYGIYCWSDPVYPLQAFDEVRDKGAPAAALTTVAWQGTRSLTYAALKAASAPQGGGVTCPSIACVKWWTQPAGDLTADLRGEVGAGYVERTADIVQRIVEAGPGTPFAAGTIAAANALRTAPVGWVAKDENTTVAAMIEELLGHSSLLWLLDATGAIVIRPWAWGASVASAISQSVKRTATHKPVGTRKLGYARNETQTARGSLAAIVFASDASYLDGTPLENLKPAQAASDKTAANTAAAIVGQGALATSVLGDDDVTNSYVSDANICPNGGLQQAAKGWSIGIGHTVYKNSAATGPDYYIRATDDLISSVSPNSTGTEKSFKVHLNERLFVSFLGRARLANSATCRGRVRIQWYDATETFISSSDIFLQPSVANTWVRMTGIVQAPTNAVKGVVRFTPNATATNFFDHGPVYISRADVVFLGSVAPTVPSASFAYTSTTASLTISWPALTIYRADGTTIAVSAGSQAIATLTAGTSYKAYPYLDDNGGTTGSISFVTGGSGSTGMAFAGGNAAAAAAMNLQGNIPLGPLLVSTTSSGTGGGGGGGSACLHPTMDVCGMPADALTIGDQVQTPFGVATIRNIVRRVASDWRVLLSGSIEIARVTPGHVLYLAMGEPICACEVVPGMLLRSAGDHVLVTAAMLDTEPAELVGIDIGGPHLHYAGPRNLLMHNGTAKP